MIKILGIEEKQSSRRLYDEAFEEDSESFKDYYYSEKIRDNTILADIEGEKMRAMLHLNPYRMRFFGGEYEIDYIVAVATAKAHRRKGLMRGLLLESFRRMYREQKPFTFLLPANPAYYAPFDFAFISNYTKTVLREKAELSRRLYRPEDRPELIGFFDRFMESVAEVYCIRDGVYLDRLLRELESERGFIELFTDADERLVGAASWWGLEKTERREWICDPRYARLEESEKPYMMARIIDLGEFLSNIRLKCSESEEEISVSLRVHDAWIEENDGYFLWRIGKEGSKLERCSEACEEYTEFDIAQLGAWLFGYREENRADWCEKIHRACGVFINEAV